MTNATKDRSLRLIDFLTELTRLRSKIIRGTDEYQSVLWLHEIPHDSDYCFTRAWAADEELGSDTWIEIRKYDEPILDEDEIPKICAEWVNNSALYDTDSLPELLSSIVVSDEYPISDSELGSANQGTSDKHLRTLDLSEFPEVSETWMHYVDSKWWPWAEAHRQWQDVQKVYAKLFAIHQDQQKLGEEYELIIGLGILNWRTPSGQSVHRHLVIAKGELIFEPTTGRFKVTAPTDGPQLDVELDMLDIEDQPTNAQQIKREWLSSANDDLWDRSSINQVLRALTNSLSRGQGQYNEDVLKPSQQPQSKPIVDYAPALILRRRSVKGLEEALKEMHEKIESGGDIPPLFLNLCESDTDRDGSPSDDKNIRNNPDQTIYFPKPANAEQRQIVEKLRSTNGVLVQGPPGTGKSHTIANLICHLLATGQRVLVTAKTPRALKVLHEKLPDEMQPLCISLLGSGIEEHESLKRSVDGILSKQDGWREEQADEEVEQLTKYIQKAKSEQAQVAFILRSIRESETFHHSILDGSYSGTSAKIALRLQKESSSFGWLRDKIKYDIALPSSPEELKKLRTQLVFLNPALEAELELSIPVPGSDLPATEVVENVIRRLSASRYRFSLIESLILSPWGRKLEQADPSRISEIIAAVSKLVSDVEALHKQTFPWIKEAVQDLLSGKGNSWKEMLQASLEILRGLKLRAQVTSNVELNIQNNHDLKKVLWDAKSLKQYLDKGGKTSWWMFKPQSIRTLKYLTEDVYIDGHRCDSPERLKTLIECISVEQKLDSAWNLWAGKATRRTGPSFLQAAELEELHEALAKVVSLTRPLEAAKASVNNIQSLGEPAWHDLGNVHEFFSVCETAIAKHELIKAQKELNRIVSGINRLTEKADAHPIAREAVSVLESENVQAYSRLLQKATELQEARESLNWTRLTISKLSEHCLLLIRELSENPNDAAWDLRLEEVDKAWNWARANSWLRDFLSQHDVPSLQRRAKQIEEDILANLARLSALKAWKFCFQQLRKEQRSHLMGWQQAIRRLGRATGRHAPTHRRNAQMHLNHCRDAVPAWIMPLHRVYETVRATPDAFDVIIVDEASQCGFESLPLTYLSKHLVVVGDDQQISPEAVGINQDQVFSLMRKHLNDFEHKDSFDIESSLFDHAKRRFNNRIVLREHFRCMPEIIRFSNDLSYRATPLIPLREYPPERLDPLKRRHIQTGYREGTGNHVINRPEAEEIVETVVQCCNDEQYDGKTMGVIVLQGEAQATLIENMLLEQLGAEEIEDRRLICGNPYSFQGDERDVIFLSMVAAPNERIGALTKAADQRRFNVAASRARDQMWLFHTATRNALSKFCFRRRLLEYFENPISQITGILGEGAEELRRQARITNRQIEKPPKPYDSWFEVDVVLHIASRGYRVVPQYPVAEKRIDLVIEGTKSRLAVECDGDYWHGPDQYEKDMERQRMLERCGWCFYRIRESAFNANPAQSLVELWEELRRRGIYPIGQETALAQVEQGRKEGLAPKSVHRRAEYVSGFTSSVSGLDDDLGHENEAIVTDSMTIQDVLRMKPYRLREAIIETLKGRPNCSCVKDALPGFVLKHLQVTTRGKPREAFTRRVNQALKHLQKEAVIEIYKSKNVRVRLVTQHYLTFDSTENS